MTEAAPLLDAPVGDGLLVFDPTRIRAHGLNASAAIVWRALLAAAAHAGRHDPRGCPVDLDDVTDRVLAVVGPGPADAPEVRAQVRAVVAQLEDEGLAGPAAATDPPARDVTATGFPNVPFTDEPAPALADALWVHRSGPYRGVDVTFDLACDDAVLGAFLAQALRPLLVRPEDDGAAGGAIGGPNGDERPPPVRRYQVVHGTETFEPQGLVVLDGHVVARPGRGRHVAALVLWHINQLVSETSTRWMVHASAIVPRGARAREAIVFPARRNAGKSTLVTGLVLEGHEYVTDEAVAIDATTDRVVPYPKAITLERGSWPLFPALDLQAHGADPFAHDRWYCDIEAGGAGRAVRDRVAIGAVVFPSYEPGHPTELEPVAPIEAAVALAENSFNLGLVGASAIPSLARLAERAPCFRLRSGDLETAIAALAPVVAALGSG